MRHGHVDGVLARLGVEWRDPDLAGLRSVYAAWCSSVPFENTLKLIHMSEGLAGPLPGSTADAFFDAWLDHGTGGTCWSGNGALHDLLSALGFEVERALATMLARPDVPGPNHGSVVVTMDGERWIVDASILSGDPIRIPEPGQDDASGPLPRFVWLEDKPAVLWRVLSAPDGFPCRIDQIGAGWDAWNTLHQCTSEWSPFNYQLSTRLMRGGESFGASGGQHFVFQADGTLEASPLDAADRTRFLVEDLGVAEQIARRVPPDRPVPARP